MNIDLIQGEAIEQIKLLKDNSIGLVCTDPPFLHVKGGMKSKRVNTGTYKPESYVNVKMSDFDEKNIYQLLNALKTKFINTFNGYFFCSKLQIVSYLKFAVENKLNYDLLIWDRDKNSMISTKFYTSNIDYVVRIYGKGNALNKIINKQGKGDVNYYKKIQKYKHPKQYGHETEKPIELLSIYILLSSKENDIVLDPFMGSGSTAIACINLDRNFIGIELEKKYYEVAKKRVEEKRKEKENEQQTLFGGMV